MDVREAVEMAIRYVREVFGDTVMHLALEEVVFDEQKGSWHVTVGFTRPWDLPTGIAVLSPRINREYKVVDIVKDRPLNIRNRVTEQSPKP